MISNGICRIVIVWPISAAGLAFSSFGTSAPITA